MAKSIQLAHQIAEAQPGINSSKLRVWTQNPTDMPLKVFVVHRVHNHAKDTTQDTFAAVATPTQLEDFAEDSPNPGTGYFLTDSIELVSSTEEHLKTVFDSIMYDVKQLVEDLEALDNLSGNVVYNITAGAPVTLVP